MLKKKFDSELQELINISGLQEKFIAEQLDITPGYFSLIKYGDRRAASKRIEVKLWLIKYIKNFLNFKFAA